MIDSLAEYLRSQRTLSAAEVAAKGRERAKFDLSPEDRLCMHSSHAEPQGARH